jgi:O-antigen/teichoic acid export membrane protein
VRRYSLLAAILAVLIAPPLLYFTPTLIRLTYTSQYVGATNAARLLIAAAAVQFVFGWTKSFPVTIGRPGLRVWTHGLETALVLPLVVVFGLAWGAAGAAAAVLVGVCAFAAAWTVVFVRIRPEDLQEPRPLDETLADTEAEAGAVLR